MSRATSSPNHGAWCSSAVTCATTQSETAIGGHVNPQFSTSGGGCPFGMPTVSLSDWRGVWNASSTRGKEPDRDEPAPREHDPHGEDQEAERLSNQLVLFTEPVGDWAEVPPHGPANNGQPRDLAGNENEQEHRAAPWRFGVAACCAVVSSGMDSLKLVTYYASSFRAERSEPATYPETVPIISNKYFTCSGRHARK